MKAGSTSCIGTPSWRRRTNAPWVRVIAMGPLPARASTAPGAAMGSLSAYHCCRSRPAASYQAASAGLLHPTDQSLPTHRKRQVFRTFLGCEKRSILSGCADASAIAAPSAPGCRVALSRLAYARGDDLVEIPRRARGAVSRHLGRGSGAQPQAGQAAGICFGWGELCS